MLKITKPLLLQSMYIFKQPKIGGEVVCHQDSTFLITEPESTVGFWFALEDANRHNGCLQVASGGHKGPLRNLFKRENNKMHMEELSNEPFPETDTFIEVKKGSLVLLHGRLPHYSCENKSLNSRHAYTLHVIDGKSKYSLKDISKKNNKLFDNNIALVMGSEGKGIRNLVTKNCDICCKIAVSYTHLTLPTILLV